MRLEIDHDKKGLLENQIALHHHKYDIDYICELVPLDGKIEINFAFLSDSGLSIEQKEEISDDTRAELLNLFKSEILNGE